MERVELALPMQLQEWPKSVLYKTLLTKLTFLLLKKYLHIKACPQTTAKPRPLPTRSLRTQPCQQIKLCNHKTGDSLYVLVALVPSAMAKWKWTEKTI